MKSLMRLWKVFLQSAFLSKRRSSRRRSSRQVIQAFSPLEPRKLLAGVGSEIVVNAAHDTLELDFTDSLTTIREAVHLANESEDTSRITFAPELNGHTISISSELSIGSNITLDSLFNVTISGEGQTRVFHVTEDGDFSVDGITISDGASVSGAAIHNDGVLAVENTTFEGNSATFGGAILNAGLLQLKDSVFVDNSASMWGSAIYTQQDEHMGNLLASQDGELPIVGDNGDGSFNNGNQGDFVVGNIPSTQPSEMYSSIAAADNLNLVFQSDPIFGDANVLASAEPVEVGVTVDEPVDPEEPGDDCDDGHDGGDPDPIDPTNPFDAGGVKVG